MRRHLSYANVVATLALFVALGGGAYAVSKVGSREIRNGSIRSTDLKNHKAVANRDVRPNAIKGSAVAEGTLDASKLVQVAGVDAPVCHPTSISSHIECAAVKLKLTRPATVFVVTTGEEVSIGGPSAATCDVTIDGTTVSGDFAPGESVSANTNPGATNGFARTALTRTPLPRGPHTAALSCARLSGDVQIDGPQITALAINQP